MIEREAENAGINTDRYNRAVALVKKIVDESELGYIYAFPDKRLYTPIENPKSFVEGAWRDYEGEIGVYVHTPFCTPKPAPKEVTAAMQEEGIAKDGRDALCGYCNLYTVVAPGIPSYFVECMLKEMALYKPLFARKQMRVKTVYFGGGTPSLMDPEELKMLNESISSIFGQISEAESTIECAPDTLDIHKLQGIKEAGFNRISIGVQSFDEKVLHFTGRDYNSQLAYQAIKDVLSIGFANVNGDLIIGLPLSTEGTFLDDVSTMLELRPNTITLYQDMIRPVTRFGKMAQHNMLPQVSQDMIYQWTKIADRLLQSSGYRRLSQTCWAREGGGYGQGEDIYRDVPLIGFGPGARTYAPMHHYETAYAVSTKIINWFISRWRDTVESGQFPAEMGYALDNDTKKRRDLIFGLMSPDGMKEKQASSFHEELQVLIDEGFALSTDGICRYTEKGRVHSGALSRLFFSEKMERQLQQYEHV